MKVTIVFQLFLYCEPFIMVGEATGLKKWPCKVALKMQYLLFSVFLTGSLCVCGLKRYTVLTSSFSVCPFVCLSVICLLVCLFGIVEALLEGSYGQTQLVVREGEFSL